jgi:effector-binding domain-containing protein
MGYAVDIFQRPARRVATLSFETGRDDAMFEVESALSSVWSFLLEHDSAPAGHPFTVHHHLEIDSILPAPEPWRLEAGFPIAENLQPEAPFQIRELEATLMARLVHKGPYERLVEGFLFLQAWVEAGGHEPAGPPRVVYHTDPVTVPDSSLWRTEIQWPIQA